MKCYICFGHYENEGKFPDPKLFRNKLGHDLIKLKRHITDKYFQENSPALSEDLAFLKTDKDLEKLIGLLSEFGKFARYFNLNVVIGEVDPGVDVKASWEQYENSYVINNKELLSKLADFETRNEVLDTIKRKIIEKLERFTRALARQFTLGKLGALAQQYSSSIYDFLMLNDSELGIIDYRKNTTRYVQRDHKPHKRTIKDDYNRRRNKDYKSQLIEKESYNGEWPFYAETVIIECRQKHWCVITIDNYDYALNRAAKGRYKIEDVHEAGMAILGKSVGPFIDMALKLGKAN
ncbi:hypothetical protein [Tenacibaculum aiptasiae]|uniref:hypothetical protein n=1 Tax=Tenacibaculum aiptasiae TaxID=426481 RepID=UPI00232CB8DE|nr:hypothetical protein [Tenacibaculum aiptasiae]